MTPNEKKVYKYLKRKPQTTLRAIGEYMGWPITSGKQNARYIIMRLESKGKVRKIKRSELVFEVL